LDISAVIVSYNVKSRLKLCLESLLLALQGEGNEIIVIDNNSSDGSPEMIRNEYRGIKLIENSSNRGFGAACNQGITISTGKYLLVLNPDTVVPPAAPAMFIAFMDEHPQAGAAGPRLTDSNGAFLPESKRGIPTASAALFRMSGIYKLFSGSSFVNRYYMGHIGETDTARVEALTGAFMFMLREAAEKAGLFDERYFMFGEDIDLSMQISAAGYEVWYYPAVTVTHFKGSSGAMKSYRGLRHFYRSMHLFIEKNFSQKYIFPFRALMHSGVFLSGLLAIIIRTPAIIAYRMAR